MLVLRGVVTKKLQQFADLEISSFRSLVSEFIMTFVRHATEVNYGYVMCNMQTSKIFLGNVVWGLLQCCLPLQFDLFQLMYEL